MGINIPLILDKENDSQLILVIKKIVRLPLRLYVNAQLRANIMLPWLVYDAVKWLKKNLNKSMDGYEWGSGRSTLFFAERIKKLISIEHDKKWYVTVNKWLMDRKLNNIELNFIPPQKNSTNTSPDYYNHILKYEDENFDFVLVDGRMRVRCMINAMNKVKPGGFLIYDDSHRNKEIFPILDGWKIINFTNGLTQTSIFVKPKRKITNTKLEVEIVNVQNCDNTKAST